MAPLKEVGGLRADAGALNFNPAGRRNGDSKIFLQSFGFKAFAFSFPLLPPSSISPIALLPRHVPSLNEANSLIHDKKYPEALEALNAILEKQPAWGKARAWKAKALFEMRRFRDAVEVLDRLIADFPLRADHLVARGRCYAQMNQFKKAIRNFEAALKLDPDGRFTLFHLGIAYYRLGRYETAARHFARVLQLNPGQPLLHSHGHAEMCAALVVGKQEELASEWAGWLWKQKPGMRSNLAEEMGRAYLRIKRPDKAVQWYDAAISLSPNDAFIYNERGRAHSFLGRNDKAMSDYDKAIELEPGNPFARLNRGVAYVMLGLCIEAVADLDIALASLSNARGHYFRSQAHATLGHSKLALLDAQEALRLDGGTERYMHQYNKCLMWQAAKKTA
ncbi:MAG: tetratricopeptide repeat protein [Candidatus Marsarchaeota archaeon]|nr:tetratricopeptide repeat protein [Candidatus Marsarchaeota archaeon]